MKRWKNSITWLAVALGTSQVYGGSAREIGMRGPDFDVASVASWQLGADGIGRLVLADQSQWSIAAGAPLFDSVRTTVELARRLHSPLFVAGDRSTGALERVALPESLSAADVAAEPVDGKLAVVFHGPPTPAFLRADRPWFGSARAQLAASVALATAQRFAPPRLVTIDVLTREIMDVRTP